MTRRIMKISAWAVCGAIALTLAAILGLQIFLGTGTAGKMIRERVNPMIPGRITWEKQSVSIFRGEIRIRGLQILEPGGRQAAAAKDISADIGLTDLVFGRVVIETARIRDPDIFLTLNADGRLNLAAALVFPGKQTDPAPAPETGKTPWNVIIRDFSLEGGRFLFRTPDPEQGQATTRVLLEDIGITLSGANLNQRSGRLRLSIRDGRVAASDMDIPVAGFSLEAGLAKGRVDPLNMEFRSAGSRVELSGAVADVFDKPRMADIQLAISAELSEIRKMLAIETELAGELRVQAAADGDPENPDVSLDLDYGGGRLAGIEVSSAAAEARMQDRRIDIRRLDTALADGKIASSGSIDLKSAFADGILAAPADPESMAYQLDLRAESARLSVIPGMADFSGRVSGDISLAGSGITPETLAAQITADLRAQGFSLPGSPLPPMDLQADTRAKLSGGRVTIDGLDMDARDYNVHATGTYDIFENRLDLDTAASVADLGQMAEQFGISGVSGKTTNLKARISGPAQRPEVSADLQARNMGFQDVQIGDLDAGITFSGGSLALHSLELSNNESVFALSGSIRVFDEKTGKPLSDPALDLELADSTLFLQDFLPEIAGRMAISGNINGSVKNPQGGVSINGQDIETGVQPIPAASLEARIDGRRIHLEPLAVTLAPDQSLRVNGWVSTDLDYSLAADSDPISLSGLKMLEDTGLEGLAEVSAQGDGSFQDPQMQARMRVEQISSGGQALPDAEITAGMQGRKVQAQVLAPIAADLSYDLGGNDFSVKAEMSETELAPFFALAGYRELTGEITGILRAGGNAIDPENIQAHLELSRLLVLHDEMELASARNFSASLENGEIDVPQNRINLLEQGFLEIRGGGSLDREIDITASGVFPARIAQKLVPGLDSPEGQVLLNARVDGALPQPDVSADITLENLGMGVPQTMQQLHAVNGKIRLKDQRLEFTDVSGRLDSGEFALDGEIRLENYMPAETDMTIKARNLPVQVPETMEAQISADLKLAGTREKAALSGEVILLEGYYFKDVNLSLLDRASEFGQRRRQTAPVPQMPAADLPLLENLELDISVGHRRPFVVDNNLALLNVRPQLEIGGTAAEPRLTGRAEISKGTISYRNTDFSVQKGIIDFVNPYQIEPTVDIRAEAVVREWTITLEVTGTPESLDFKLSSSPPEEDADILSLLAVGKTTRELGGSSGGSAERMLANVLGGRLEKQVKAGTGLDIVELEYGREGTGAEEDDNVRVTLGKELSRRLTVKYGAEQKGGETVRQSTAIYKLTQGLSVNAFQESEGAFGGEMRYRLEFR
ncbi:MAG: translocation/assembly module TamB domain-containing protein [Desulfobacterales bacterium]